MVNLNPRNQRNPPFLFVVSRWYMVLPIRLRSEPALSVTKRNDKCAPNSLYERTSIRTEICEKKYVHIMAAAFTVKQVEQGSEVITVDTFLTSGTISDREPKT